MKLGYYFFASYRRKIIDELQEQHKDRYKGIVLDIGGRDRGRFKSPKDKVEKWITTDIEPSRSPDMVLDVAKMDALGSESIDVVNAIELFEHVEKIDDGIRECARVLKRNGTMIISVPFLFPVHADPYDFQRWTDNKWRSALSERGLSIETFEIMGVYFTILGDSLKTLFKSFPPLVRHLQLIFYPFLDLLVSLDRISAIKNHEKLGKYHGGYFIIAKKQ